MPAPDPTDAPPARSPSPTRGLGRLGKHPDVLRVLNRRAPTRPRPFTEKELREVCLEAGAADVGFVSVTRE